MWIERLLEEAFLGTMPVEDFKASGSEYVSELIRQAPRLREHHAPGAYWSVRRGTTRRRLERSLDQLHHDFARLIATLQADGYLERAFPSVCVDDQTGVDSDPEALLAERLGVEGLWPLRPSLWDDEDLFFDLIEVFHDLIARPRSRGYHSWNQCGWHYSDFSSDIGRALYRWKVNALLASGGLELNLADRGEDVGRLVRRVDGGREELVVRALATAEFDVLGPIQHAIALFRRRGATEHDKRSAIVALAHVLEDRRKLLKDTLFTDDEGALFMIANKFDLRHRNDKQHTNYDPAFRDWVFWWYLATIELTDRIRDRQ